jgi:O-antigen/teichoic acid export membrane protein
VTSRTAHLRSGLATAAPVGGGLALVGLAAYVVLALAGHNLAPPDYAAAASMFQITAIVGPGVFVAVEQQTNREVSGRIAAGLRIGPSVWAVFLVTAGLTVLMCALVLALSPVLVPRVFAGHRALVTATLLAVAGAAAAYLMRGVFGGQRRYRWYGISLAGEGLGRLVPCVLLVLLGWADADRFGFVFAVGCGLAALITLPGLLRGRGIRGLGVRAGPTRCAHRPDSPGLGGLARAVGLLAGASALTLMMINLGPVVLSWRLGATLADRELAASFISLFLLARVPLFLFGPVQAFLLPKLTEAAQCRDDVVFRATLRLALLAVLAVGLAGVLGVWLLGPWATRVFFNASIELPRSVAVLLGVGTVAMMAAQILQPALVALGRNRAATVSWIVSSAVFVGLLFAPIAPLTAAVTAQVVAPILVTAMMALSLRELDTGLKLTHVGLGEERASAEGRCGSRRTRGTVVRSRWQGTTRLNGPPH